jgi:RNA polymerase sigma factor (sigma-70 family)
MNFPQAIDTVEEFELIRKGNKRALDKLALVNMAEALDYSRHCSRGEFPEGELVSLCWIALRQAAKNFRKRKSNGIRFFAFTKQYLRGQINREFKRRLVVKNSYTTSADYPEKDKPLVDTYCEPDFSNLETKELFNGLRPAIFGSLNDRERAILILRYESGFSFGEIGDRLGYSRQHIQNLHSGALKKLRVVLQSKKDQLL